MNQVLLTDHKNLAFAEGPVEGWTVVDASELEKMPAAQLASLTSTLTGKDLGKPKDKRTAVAKFLKLASAVARPISDFALAKKEAADKAADKAARAEKKAAKKAEKKAEKKAAAEARGPHPISDRRVFVLTFNPNNGRQQKALEDLPKQGRVLIDVMRATGRVEFTGSDLRVLFERDRDKNFPGSKQAEIFRIFQDYRARYVRAGIVDVRPLNDEK